MRLSKHISMPDQLPLFDQRTMREKLRVPLDKDLCLKGKAAYDSGNMKEATELMRELRYRLENFCSRINHRK